MVVSFVSSIFFNLCEPVDALLLQELEKSDCAALRNNLVVAMTDFCVHYTAMIEWYFIHRTLIFQMLNMIATF